MQPCCLTTFACLIQFAIICEYNMYTCGIIIIYILSLDQTEEGVASNLDFVPSPKRRKQQESVEDAE